MRGLFLSSIEHFRSTMQIGNKTQFKVFFHYRSLTAPLAKVSSPKILTRSQLLKLIVVESERDDQTRQLRGDESTGWEIAS
jgi:hypothetical protein